MAMTVVIKGNKLYIGTPCRGSRKRKPYPVTYCLVVH